MHVITLPPGHWVLSRGLWDPFTKDPFRAGSRVVRCAHCKLIFSEETWRHVNDRDGHRGLDNTLPNLEPRRRLRFGRALGAREPTRLRVTGRQPPTSRQPSFRLLRRGPQVRPATAVVPMSRTRMAARRSTVGPRSAAHPSSLLGLPLMWWLIGAVAAAILLAILVVAMLRLASQEPSLGGPWDGRVTGESLDSGLQHPGQRWCSCGQWRQEQGENQQFV